MATTTTNEADHIGYVRRRLGAMPSGEYVRVAADAGVSLRTLYHIQDSGNDARYRTVMSLYKVLKASEPRGRKARQ